MHPLYFNFLDGLMSQEQEPTPGMLSMLSLLLMMPPSQDYASMAEVFSPLSLLLMMPPPQDHVSIAEVFPPLGLLLMMVPSENEVVEGDDVAAMWTSTVGLLYGRKA